LNSRKKLVTIFGCFLLVFGNISYIYAVKNLKDSG